MRILVTLIIVVSLALVCISFEDTSVYAKPYKSGKAGGKHTYTCPVNGANDFHITYYWLGPMRIIAHYDDNFTTFTPVPLTPDSSVWSCTWSGATYNQGQQAELGVTFEQEFYRNALGHYNIEWTENGVPVAQNIPGAGFQVEPAMGAMPEITYFVKNISGAAFTVKNLQFKFSTTETDLSAASYPVGGFDSPRPNITLAHGDSFAVALSPPLSPPYYLLAQGIINQGGVDVGNFIHQHEHPVNYIPTLTGWGIAIIVLLLLAAGTVAVCRKRRMVSA